MGTSEKTILVTGGNKGIGLEVCRQLAQAGHRVILSARSVERGQAAVRQLGEAGLTVDFLELDTASETSIARAVAAIEEKYPVLHILINNAAILATWQGTILESKAPEFRNTFETNVIGPILLTLGLLPLLEKSRPSRVINVSSQLGSVANMTDGWAGYGISKAALNAATRKLASALKSKGVSVLAASPGWVRTEMGGAQAPLSVEQGGRNIARLVAEPPLEVTNQFLEAKGEIPW